MLRVVLWIVLALWLVVGGGVFVVALSGGVGRVRAALDPARLRLLVRRDRSR